MTATPQRFAMQQPMPTRESTAAQLDQAVPWQPAIRTAGERTGQDRQSARRTPLALVPAPRRKSGRGFVALCVGILLVALMTVLVTNIAVSNGQYQLVSLKNEQLDLNQSNERLRQQVEHLQAPQNLAAEAGELGMVNPGSIAAIDLSTGNVTGSPTPADAEDKPSDRVAAPASPEQQQDEAAQGGSVTAADAERPAQDQQDGQPQAGSANDEAAPQDASSQRDSSGADQTGASAGSEDLNGGTIPAPQFAASGD
jgi:hypothetical protein